MNASLLEIIDPNLKPTPYKNNLTKIPVIDRKIDYAEFFQSFLLTNTPCILSNTSESWPCTGKWITDKSINIDYFRNNLHNNQVPISNCGKREYNVQKKCSMTLFDYLEYWEKYRINPKEMDCLYLKDWHFVKEYPDENMYRVPSYFASDWLNEFYDNNLEYKDDYRFVYIGPKGSWTPFHADVFTSYSWSVNVNGRKKWILIPPGAEDNFRDALGNLNYDIDLSQLDKEKEKFSFPIFEVIQESGQGLFVPSGWHHQVWNLEDTISINHNWINGCNIQHVWNSLQKNLNDVIKEISDCKEMDNWAAQCQLVLSASFGINYQFFHSFLVDIAKVRIEAMKSKKELTVFGNWHFGGNHMKFDLKQVYLILKELVNDDNYLEVAEGDTVCDYKRFFDELSDYV